MSLELDAYESARHLRWLLEAGADEVVSDAPVDRFAAAAAAKALPVPDVTAPARAFASAPTSVTTLSQRAPISASEQQQPRRPPQPALEHNDAIVSARTLAASASTLEELERAMQTFEGCGLKITAHSLVFADGNPKSGIMFVGEAPGSDEDRQGKPFVGRSGQLLDKMLAAIGLDRTKAYIGNVIPWRPPGNRTPSAEEVAICLPFIRRQIALANPRILVLLGGTPVKHLLETDAGITRIRGQWKTYSLDGLSIPALPTFHPAYLLRQPAVKKMAWADFLALSEKLRQ
jgi:DNA polymerase